jgi:hypothetical protein
MLAAKCSLSSDRHEGAAVAESLLANTLSHSGGPLVYSGSVYCDYERLHLV